MGAGRRQERCRGHGRSGRREQELKRQRATLLPQGVRKADTSARLEALPTAIDDSGRLAGTGDHASGDESPSWGPPNGTELHLAAPGLAARSRAVPAAERAPGTSGRHRLHAHEDERDGQHNQHRDENGYSRSALSWANRREGRAADPRFVLPPHRCSAGFQQVDVPGSGARDRRDAPGPQVVRRPPIAPRKGRASSR